MAQKGSEGMSGPDLEAVSGGASFYGAGRRLGGAAEATTGAAELAAQAEQNTRIEAAAQEARHQKKIQAQKNRDENFQLRVRLYHVVQGKCPDEATARERILWEKDAYEELQRLGILEEDTVKLMECAEEAVGLRARAEVAEESALAWKIVAGIGSTLALLTGIGVTAAYYRSRQQEGDPSAPGPQIQTGPILVQNNHYHQPRSSMPTMRAMP